jgi:hypothetical protein
MQYVAFCDFVHSLHTYRYLKSAALYFTASQVEDFNALESVSLEHPHIYLGYALICMPLQEDCDVIYLWYRQLSKCLPTTIVRALTSNSELAVPAGGRLQNCPI